MIYEVNVKQQPDTLKAGREKVAALMDKDPDVREYMTALAVGALQRGVCHDDKIASLERALEDATAHLAAARNELTEYKEREKAARKVARYWFEAYVEKLVGHGRSPEDGLHG